MGYQGGARLIVLDVSRDEVTRVESCDVDRGGLHRSQSTTEQGGPSLRWPPPRPKTVWCQPRPYSVARAEAGGSKGGSTAAVRARRTAVITRMTLLMTRTLVSCDAAEFERERAGKQVVARVQ